MLRSILCALVAASLSAAARPVSAALFAVFDLEQSVSYSYIDVNGVHKGGTPVSDQSVPFHATAAADSGNGAIVTSTYDVYDTGATAGFSIRTSGSVSNSLTGTVFETTASGPYTNFGFSQPVTYDISIYNTSPSSAEFYLQGGTLGHGYINITVQPNTNYDFVGTMDVIPRYTLGEQWAVDSSQTRSGTTTGGETIVFTFTPIPEPSSAALLLASVALISYRRR